MSPDGNIVTHMIVWSDLATQGFVPCLDSRLKPKKVLFLCPPEAVSRVKSATDEFNRYGVNVDYHAIPDSWNINEVRNKVSKVISREGTGLALNLSGVNNALAIGAYDVFREKKLPIFSIDVTDDQVTWIYPEEVDSFDLEDRIDITTFLRLNGFEVEESDKSMVSSEHRELGKALVKKLNRFGRDLHELNWLANNAKGNLVSPPVNPGATDRDSYQELLDLFTTADLLAVSGNRIEFRNEGARQFVCGGWLEDHVFSELRGLSGTGGIQDVGRGVRFSTSVGGQPVYNELDVVFLADNRLYFIECKTTKMNHSPEGFKAQNSFLYKLHSLKSSVGGKQTEAMLISYKSMGQRQLERAHAMGLEICCGHDVADIKSRVQKWISES